MARASEGGPVQALTIVCPVDDSDCSKRALRYAGALAEHFGARLVVLHVFCPLGAGGALIVMSLGSSAMRRRKPGSIAYRVLCLAPVPVLALPETSSRRFYVEYLHRTEATNAR